jgi:hypothetical protein
VLGEDDGLSERRLAGDSTVQNNELRFISEICNAVIVVADSPGVFSELGLFSWHFVNRRGLLYGTRGDTEFILLLDKRFETTKSYLKEGPARSINAFGVVSYVDFATYDIEPVLTRVRDRRGVMIVDNRRGRPKAA